MPRLNTAHEVDTWLQEHGWFAGRDVSGQVPAMVGDITREYQQAGFPVEAFDAATRFLGEFGGLRLTMDAERRDFIYLTPYVVYGSAPADVAELSGNLGVRLFPVGCDTSEGSPILIDEQGRFFMVHETGNYYMGKTLHEAVISLAHAPMEDAEDYFV